MSNQSLYTVRKNGDVVHGKDYKNAFRGAFLVWDKMSKKHLGDYFSFPGNARRVWDLWKDKNIPAHERVLIASTFDNVMIRKEHFQAFIDAVKKCGEDLSGHFYRNAIDIQELLSDPNCVAVCWNQTSVCCPWTVWLEGGSSRPYNIYRDKKHWFLFDELVE